MSHHEGEETWLLGAGLLVGTVLGTLWLSGAVSAALFGSGWTSIDFGQLLQTLGRLPPELADPAKAWPRGARSQLPGPLPFYLTLSVIAAAALALVAAIGRLARSLPRAGRARPASARWAAWTELRSLRVWHSQPRRLTLGRQGGTLIAAEALQSAIVVAPTQSGKTTGLAIPALLEWEGPVVATSIKTDLLRDTVECRRQLGEVMVYDPTESTGFEGVRATPLAGATTWRGAMRVASWLCASADSRAGLENADFWHAAAAKLLAPLIYAAATNGLTMADAVRWLDSGPGSEPEVTELLERSGSPDALLAWRATWNRDERQRSPIFTTAETIVSAFADPRVQAASSAAEYTPARLLDGRSNTLYLCAPAHEQERLRPLFSMMIREILAVVYEAAAATGRALDPPLLLALDEAANIAPIPNLDEIASSGAGQGIQLLTVFQDLAQVRKRYGADRARTILNNHRAKLFGSGISDPDTLEYVSRLVGAGEFRQRSETSGEVGRRSTTEATTFRDLAPTNVVREARPGSALLLYGHLPAAQISLRPWFSERRLRALAHCVDGEEVAG